MNKAISVWFYAAPERWEEIVHLLALSINRDPVPNLHLLPSSETDRRIRGPLDLRKFSTLGVGDLRFLLLGRGDGVNYASGGIVHLGVENA